MLRFSCIILMVCIYSVNAAVRYCETRAGNKFQRVFGNNLSYRCRSCECWPISAVYCKCSERMGPCTIKVATPQYALQNLHHNKPTGRAIAQNANLSDGFQNQYQNPNTRVSNPRDALENYYPNEKSQVPTRLDALQNHRQTWSRAMNLDSNENADEDDENSADKLIARRRAELNERRFQNFKEKILNAKTDRFYSSRSLS